ncbi:HNH endonuclease [Pseudomonas syringae]|uniref:HNH endonuclease n=1 Tax=Pseudomonas syringae TaxID=317 RepID=UPI000A8CDEB2|nr:HNH endonuclease [Pseudomonas syringae]
MAVWVIAAGGLNDAAALENYSKTLAAPISKVRLESLPPEVRLPDGDLYAWGFPRTQKGANERKFVQLAIGDICFFCTTRCEGRRSNWSNAYHWVAKVVGKVDDAHSAAVSLAFWDSENFFPYLLSEPLAVNISFDEFSREIDPVGMYYGGSPQSSTRLTDLEKLRHVVDKYGSVDEWAENYIARLSVLPVAAENNQLTSVLSRNAPKGSANKVDYKVRLPIMREWLVRVAQASGRVTYREYMDVFGIDRYTSKHSMDRLGEYSQELGEPIITALIVSGDSNRSSAGLNKFGVLDDEAERQKLYNFWSGVELDISDSLMPDSLEIRAVKFASIETRPEQAAFRRKLFSAYRGRCVVSGCDVVRALDAAHRHGRQWRKGHNNAEDGFLLRKDLHALYDSKLLRISDSGVIELSDEVLEHYESFSGIFVSLMQQW